MGIAVGVGQRWRLLYLKPPKVCVLKLLIMPYKLVVCFFGGHFNWDQPMGLYSSNICFAIYISSSFLRITKKICKFWRPNEQKPNEQRADGKKQNISANRSCRRADGWNPKQKSWPRRWGWKLGKVVGRWWFEVGVSGWGSISLVISWKRVFPSYGLSNVFFHDFNHNIGIPTSPQMLVGLGVLRGFWTTGWLVVGWYVKVLAWGLPGSTTKIQGEQAINVSFTAFNKLMGFVGKVQFCTSQDV